MKIYAIGDVHLSFSRPVNPQHWENVEQNKPMDVFGEEWREHYRKIYENWVKTVSAGDLVFLPGDISWALKLNEARFDLEFLGFLPGQIICIAGNHDYWWQSLSKVRAVLPDNIRVIQNDHVQVGNMAICGSRGWWCPGSEQFKEEDFKIYRRELIRMENSLRGIVPYVKEIIVMIHFMPTNERHDKSEFIELFQRYDVKTVVYSHLHGSSARLRLPDYAWGINFHLASADFINFTPALIKDVN